MTNRFLRAAMLALLGSSAIGAHAASCPTIAIAPLTALPAATVGATYSQTFTADGSSALPYGFAVTSGFPTGIGLGTVATGSTSADLIGTPAQAGNFLITFTATDTDGCSGGRTYAFAIGVGSQTISFTSPAPANASVGGAPYNVTATATSGLAVAFSIDASAASVCSIAGSTVSFQTAGSCVVDANQPGDANWNAASQAQQTVSVGAGSQTISFISSAPGTAVVGGAAYDVSAMATSGLAVAFSIDASASSVCAIAGSSVTFQGAGTCVVDADQAGDANYNAAVRAQQSFAVGKGNQTITFASTAPAGAAVAGVVYDVSATASSGLAVAFTIDPAASGVCSIIGSSVSFQGVGTCVIDADQVGDANYNTAPRVQQSFAVGIGSQTVAFTSSAPSTAIVAGSTYSVGAAATSGLPVALSIDAGASAVCSLAGSVVSFQGVGTCVIDADQPGNANYAAAPQVQQSFAVAIGNQTIAFASSAPVDAAVGGPTYIVFANASSALPVTLGIDASASSVCSIAGDTVSYQNVGTCVIDADQAGDANYNPAPQVQQSFAVVAGTQGITFTSTTPADAVVAGATYIPSATATSGLAVTMTIDASASAVCSIAGGAVSFQAAGTCVIDANQAGDTNWNAAPQLQQSFAIGKGTQTIAFSSASPTDASMGGTYGVAAAATSGLPVAFTIDASASGVCSITGTTISFIAAGTCVIDADQAGDGNWNAAAQAQQSFAVSPCVTLALGEVVRAAMPGGATACVMNADADNAEYAYMSIDIGTAGGDSNLSLTASNIVATVGPPASVTPPSAQQLAPMAPTEFVDPHALTAPPAFPVGQPIDKDSLLHYHASTATPLTVGQLIDLDTAVGNCSAVPDVRKGRVEAITTAQSPGQQLLFGVQEVIETTPGAGDWHPPVTGGYQTQDFQNIIDAFVQAPPGSTPGGGATSATQLKTGAMDLVSSNFGAVTDIDSNGGVIVFFTRKLNELAPPASGSTAQGLFQSRDFFSAASCAASNQGEIIYMMVPDPTGQVNSNVRTVSFAYGNAEPMLVHHFEHMVNAGRRLYLSPGAPLPLEEAWLDEALAWETQELVFFNTATGIGPRGNIQLSSLTTGPNASTRVTAFNTFENPIFGSVRTYFLTLSGTFANRRFGPLRQQAFVIPGPDAHEQSVQPYGVTSAFLRYALDRKNTGDAALLQALVNGSQTGMAKLQTVFGADPNDWMQDFIVAMYSDDAGIAGVSTQYTLPSWNYRSVYGGLGGYTLALDPLSNGVAVPFTLTYGGGARYARFGVAPGQMANVALTEGGVTPTSPITTAIVRTK